MGEVDSSFKWPCCVQIMDNSHKPPVVIDWSNRHMKQSDSQLNLTDYRCEDGSFPVSASCVTISNPNSLSSSGTGVNPGIRS